LPFQFFEDAADEFLGVRDRTCDHLDVHGRFSRLAGALAVDTVLTDEHERVGQDVEGDGEASTGDAHHELVFLEFFAAIFVYAHTATA